MTFAAFPAAPETSLAKHLSENLKRSTLLTLSEPNFELVRVRAPFVPLVTVKEL